MPNTPRVNFDFQNNNVQASVPLLGVSHVVARTTRGKFNDPSELITSWAQFQRIFGDEIVPDGSISNIKKALEIGSKIRVSRVAGGESEPSQGVAKMYSKEEDEWVAGDEAQLMITLINPENLGQQLYMIMNVKTKEAGSPVLDDTGYGLNRDFYLRFSVNSGPNYQVSLTQFKRFSDEEHNSIATADILATNLLFSGSKMGAANPFVEASVLQDFVNGVANIELTFVGAGVNGNLPGGTEIAARIKTIEDVIGALRTYANWYGKISIGSKDLVSGTPMDLIINEGENGGKATADTWREAYNATKDYNDAYQVILSHLAQYSVDDLYDNSSENGTSVESILTYVGKDVAKNFEEVLYVEVPKYEADGSTPRQKSNIISWLETNMNAIGPAKNIAYFAGGIKYYDENGTLQNNDVLGTVIGLGDVSASNYGPWYSFSGMNRGVVSDAMGPVMDNLGSPSRVEDLQELAEWYTNLFVIKDTRTQGKRTMLWHGFTSNPKNDSEKFLSIVRLNLYIKKNLRPILESYIEEPNIWDTWKKIYLEGKEIMDDLKDNNAISSYQWLGDQDAQNYSDLQVNNEADVRQGKYKIILKYKDIVPMQEITIVVAIDAVSKEISITAED